MPRRTKRKVLCGEGANGTTKLLEQGSDLDRGSISASRVLVQPFPTTISHCDSGASPGGSKFTSTLLQDRTAYRFRSPPIGRMRRRPNELFLSGGCRFVGILERSRRLLFDSQYERITIHAVGRAIEKAVRASLVLIDRYEGWLTCAVSTSSVPIVDEYEPQRPALPWIRQTRIQSAIHIHLIKLKKLPAV
jgi:hypothetical protein